MLLCDFFRVRESRVKTVKELRMTNAVAMMEQSQKEGNLSHRVNILQSNPGKAGNFVTTSKYTPLTFLPKNLYELLHPRKRFANFYFLCVGILQMIPAITITDGLPIQWLPLLLILAVDMTIASIEASSSHFP
jgi:hypothetical protein